MRRGASRLLNDGTCGHGEIVIGYEDDIRAEEGRAGVVNGEAGGGDGNCRSIRAGCTNAADEEGLCVEGTEFACIEDQGAGRGRFA